MTNATAIIYLVTVTNNIPVSVEHSICGVGPGCAVYHAPTTNYQSSVATQTRAKIKHNGVDYDVLLSEEPKIKPRTVLVGDVEFLVLP